MKKFISYQKMNKKKRKEIDKQKRGDWGDIKPVTKVVQSKKVYNRKSYKKGHDLWPFSNLSKFIFFL